MPGATFLPDRGVLRLSGNDARRLLQGLITNDVERLHPDRALYSALLTPQGKFLFAFHLWDDRDGLLLETSAERVAELERRLVLYRLRAAVAIERVEPLPAAAILFGDGAAALAGLPAERGAARREGDLRFAVDPRLAVLGVRLLGPEPELRAWLDRHGVAEAPLAEYERHRIALAVPEADIDLVVDKTIMLEAGLDQLDAVAFGKGCFVGQELTARTRYRGLVKRRLVPLRVEGGGIEPGLAVMAGEREAGELRSTSGDMALAMLRLDRLDAPLDVAGRPASILPAPWQAELAAQPLEPEKG